MATYFDCDDNCGLSFYLRDLSSVPRGSRQELWFFLCAIGQVVTQSETNTELIIDAIEGLTPVIGANQTATRVRVTTNGSVADDTYGSVTFFSLFTNLTVPTVLGVDLEAGRSVTFSADEGRGLDAIAYTASATATLEIERITK